MAAEKRTSLLDRWKKSDRKKSLSTTISKAPKDISIPLSSAQQRLWFLQQLYPANTFYNVSTGLAFTGKLKKEFLKESLASLFKNHDILRSSYPLKDGSPIIHIEVGLEIDLKEIDFSSLPDNEAKSETNRYIVEQASTCFDLSTSPLIKASLIKISKSEYLLFLTMHHIIVDLWSIGIIKEQLAKNYNLLNQGGQLTSERPEIQYSDYAHWQGTRLTDKFQLTYWKEKLSGELPILDLQSDFKHPVVPSFKGRHHTRQFTAEFSGRILSLAKTLEVTPFVLLLSAYYVLLSRHSGQNDILIGTPISSRSEKSLEALIGFFVDTVVLRSQLGPGQPFSEFVKQVQTNVLEAFSNKDVPFDQLVKELKWDRSLSTNPLFQVMFVFYQEPGKVSFGEELHVEDQIDFNSEVSKFNLTLLVSEKNGNLTITFEYATDLFEEPTIMRFHEHLKLILEAVIDDHQCRINDISILTGHEREFFLQSAPISNGPFSVYRGIHEIIEIYAKETYNAKAVIYDKDSLTYGELSKKATSIVPSILEKTKGENEIVGLGVDRSLDMIIGLLAILKAGCAYLPIDPEYPAQRIDFMLDDSKVKLMLTSKKLKQSFENFNGTLLSIDDQYSERDSSTITFPEPAQDNLAYVIYTSGSTGNPKGVPISHKNIINSTEGRLTFYRNNPSVFLLMSSFAFDSSKAGIFWTLCTGGTLLISKKHAEQDIEGLAKTIKSHEVSHTLMLPSLYNLLLQYADGLSLQSLSTIIVAGEACFPDLAKRHFEILPKADLYNEYGPTEATVWCIAHKIIKENSYENIPIGRPVANARVYLLDEKHNLVPYGAVGEICIGGPGLSVGYLNRNDLTEKAYFESTLGKFSGQKLYKTGDRGRYNRDGDIEFLGRVDHQVKIRGYRIELGEIENAILKNDSVQDVVVLVEESLTVNRLVAFVIPIKEFDSQGIKTNLKSVFPDYMVPAVVAQCREFPTLPNGKVDRDALLNAERRSLGDTAQLALPENEVQLKLKEIWQQVLNVGQVGINDNFFELGGDSISSIQIIAKARKQGIALKANQLFDHQTIAELSLFTRMGNESTFFEKQVSGEVQMTPIQHWFFDMHKAAPHYWNHIMRVSGIEKVDYAHLKEVVEKLVSYHDALCLSFTRKQGRWKAYISRSVNPRVFQYFDLSSEKELSMQDDRVAKILLAEQENCDLAKGNLFRMLYFECGGLRENKAFFVAHHLVVDKVSWNAIFSDFSIALNQKRPLENNIFKQKTVSVKKWGEHLAELAKSFKIREELPFWESQVDDLKTTSNILNSNDTFFREDSIKVYQSFEDEEVTDRLMNKANKAYHTKIEDLLITALLSTVCELTEQNQLCLGLERHGRDSDITQLDASNTVGWFTSFFPVTLKHDVDTLSERIKSVKEQLRAIPNKGIGYGLLKYLSDVPDIKKILNQSPQIIFNYLGVRHNTFEQLGTTFDFQLEGSRSSLSERTYGLEINAFISDKKLCMNWVYSADVYEESILTELVNGFSTKLKELIDHCSNVEKGSYTPSDFPEAELSQDDLDSLMNRFQ